MTRLLINAMHLREIFEPDGFGGSRPPEKSRFVTIEVTNAIGDDSEALFFNTAIRIPKNLCTDRSDAEELAVGFLRTWLPAHIAKTDYWNFHVLTVEDYKDSPRADKDGLLRQVETTVMPTESLAQVMAEAVQHNRAVRAAFEAAKSKLSNFAFHNTPFGFQESVNEARRCFDIIGDILDCSATLGGYTSSDSRYAFGRYQELARRKVENNHNYQHALTQVQRFAFGVTFPRVWGRQPPLRA